MHSAPVVSGSHAVQRREHGAIDAGTVDPVCGMLVDPQTAAHRHSYHGHPYYFCSDRCRSKFAANPATYLGSQAGKPAAREGAGTIFTCPMHPEIRQSTFGACPICGMALEPLVTTTEMGENLELVDMTRRLWSGLVLTIPVVALEMSGHMANLVGQAALNWIQFVIATPVVLWAGWPFFVRGWRSVVTRNLNMFTLIAMGTGVAWIYSTVATVAPAVFPATLRSAEGAVAVYFEAAAVITVLVLLGQVLELRARERTGHAIRALLDLAPKTARRVKDDGNDEEVALDGIVVGDRLRVRPGEKVPVDGEVIEGHSSLDESMVTGESMPVTREKDSPVIGGTLNK